MNRNAAIRRWAQVLALSFALTVGRRLAAAAEHNLTRTNWTERWITNVIEVRMPTNVFVDEFHTNWLQQWVTNVVDVYATNWLTKTLTNTIPVQATRTVRVTEYQTNWTTLVLTNDVAMEAVRTNFVARWQTNWKTLTLTNWGTVLVMKTNWIDQPITNVVQIDLITNRVPVTEAAASKPIAPPKTVAEAAPLPPGAASEAKLTDALQFEAARTGRPPAHGLVEVQLRVRWLTEPAAPLQVRKWQVESQSGAVLCSGQDQEFKRELPVGTYKVEVKAQRDANSPLLAAKGLMTVTAAQAVMLAKTSAGK